MISANDHDVNFQADDVVLQEFLETVFKEKNDYEHVVMAVQKMSNFQLSKSRKRSAVVILTARPETRWSSGTIPSGP